MFYACLAILILITIICTCAVLATIDLETYNFGLYIILLCIVGTMIACALCIANPNACKNPAWYTKFCLLLQELHTEYMSRGSSSSATDHLMFLTSRHRGDDTTESQLRNGNRATVAMLAPAIHIMHHVWKGMAWITEDTSDDDEKVTGSRVNASTSEHSSRKLSIIVESSSKQSTVSIPRNLSSESNSHNDITL